MSALSKHGIEQVSCCKVFNRVIYNGCIFTGLQYKRSTRRNDAIIYQSDQGDVCYGLIESFVALPSAQPQAAIALVFQCAVNSLADAPHLQYWLKILPEPHDRLVAIPLRNIAQKCVLVQFSDCADEKQSFFSLPPNTVEAD